MANLTELYNLRSEWLDVGEEGAALPDDNAHLKAIILTPSHQFPLGGTMSTGRRLAFLQFADRNGTVVIEDDFDSEFRYAGRPIPAMASLDTGQRVIYVGSFSKSIFPGLRLGYLVGSKPFIREARALRASVLRHPPGHIQRTAAYFLSLGHYDSLVRRMGLVFAERRKVMEEALAQYGLAVAGRGVFGGSSIWMRAPDGVDTEQLAINLRAKGVLIEPGRPFFYGPNPAHNYYRLAYSSIPSSRIHAGIEILAAELTQ